MIPDRSMGVPIRRETLVRWGLFLAGTGLLGGLHHAQVATRPGCLGPAGDLLTGPTSVLAAWPASVLGLSPEEARRVLHPLVGYAYAAGLLLLPCFCRFGRRWKNVAVLMCLLALHVGLQLAAMSAGAAMAGAVPG